MSISIFNWLNWREEKQRKKKTIFVPIACITNYFSKRFGDKRKRFCDDQFAFSLRLHQSNQFIFLLNLFAFYTIKEILLTLSSKLINENHRIHTFINLQWTRRVNRISFFNNQKIHFYLSRKINRLSLFIYFHWFRHFILMKITRKTWSIGSFWCSFSLK